MRPITSGPLPAAACVMILTGFTGYSAPTEGEAPTNTANALNQQNLDVRVAVI